MLNFSWTQGNWSLICSDECGPEVHSFFSQLNEKETSFELIEALLMYIRTLNVLGFVLASLPGWNLMYIYNAEASRNESVFGTSHCVYCI